MTQEKIKKPDYMAGIRHTTVGSDRHLLDVLQFVEWGFKMEWKRSQRL